MVQWDVRCRVPSAYRDRSHGLPLLAEAADECLPRKRPASSERQDKEHGRPLATGRLEFSFQATS